MKWLELWAKIEVWGYIVSFVILGLAVLFFVGIVIYAKIEEKIKKRKGQ